MDHELSVKVDDFLVIRRPPLTPEGRTRVEERNRRNMEFLATAGQPRRGRLSGTFIYAHPPDYRGRPTLTWTVAEWRALFRELKEIGIGMVILQAAAWVDFRECYYPSELFGDYHTWNVIDPLVAAAADESMVVYLGAAGVLYGEQVLGVVDGDVSKAHAAADQELACYRELVTRYGGGFHGYYLASETGFPLVPNPHHMASFHTFFEQITNGVKELTPDMPILTSPWTTACPGREDEAVDYLSRLHANCPIDAFAPQDSIGTFSNLSFLAGGLAIWRQVCANTGAAFWVNCECFSITDPGGPLLTIVPTTMDRFAVQLDAAVEAGAQTMISWEVPHFMDANGDGAARQLRADYQAHLKATPA